MNWLSFVDWTIRIALLLRIVSRRITVSEALAWIGLIMLFPIGGPILYLVFGEILLSNRRRLLHERILPDLNRWLNDVHCRAVSSWPDDHHGERAFAKLVTSATGSPAIPGNRLVLVETAGEMIDCLIADLRRAQRSCYLEFYIWEDGGITERLVEALGEAAHRGVDCRVLVDAFGSRRFLKGPAARQLRQQGVRIQAALPVGILRFWLQRFDVRLHRKIVIIDETIGYAGSQNMADPKLFKRAAGVGQWVDAMVRVEGEAAEALMCAFLADWYVEVAEGIDQLERALQSSPQPAADGAIVQVIPTGPAMYQKAARQIIVNAIYAAERQLILTTPYYVPDDNLQMALVSAAARGVQVTLVVPRRVDSRLVYWASRPFQKDLMAAGVRVMEYERGLLHTKSITIDDGFSLFGSLNLDMRSMHLNYEITLAIYDRPFTAELQRLQQTYIAHSIEKVPAPDPSLPVQMAENVARLVAPLL